MANSKATTLSPFSSAKAEREEFSLQRLHLFSLFLFSLLLLLLLYTLFVNSGRGKLSASGDSGGSGSGGLGSGDDEGSAKRRVEIMQNALSPLSFRAPQESSSVSFSSLRFSAVAHADAAAAVDVVLAPLLLGLLRRQRSIIGDRPISLFPSPPSSREG